MTSASQFSLEEENFYKDIQYLLKKGSQDEKELSTFLQRYMDLLARAELDDETLFINFTKAALILEASTKVYGSKVDRLWVSVEQVQDALKMKGSIRKKGENDEDVEEVDGEAPADEAETHKKLPKRRRKLGDGLVSSDDFLEIDNISGMLGKNMNEGGDSGDVKLKFHEEIPNLFIRNESDRRGVDVCLVQKNDDRDDCRLRDWMISTENLLLKDIQFEQYFDDVQVTMWDGDIPVARGNASEVSSIHNRSNEMVGMEGGVEPMESEDIPDDGNNNDGAVVDPSSEPPSLDLIPKRKLSAIEYIEEAFKSMNKSREIEVGKFPNVLLKRVDEYLVDVNEVFWNPTRFQDVVPTRKMRLRKTNKPPCQLCTDRSVCIFPHHNHTHHRHHHHHHHEGLLDISSASKNVSHPRRGRRCHSLDKTDCLDNYLGSLAQPAVQEPPLGILPGEELQNVYKVELKLIDKLSKIDANKNMYEAYHPENADEEERNEDGFDLGDRMLTNEPSNDGNEVGEANDIPLLGEGNEDAEPLESDDLELPLPATEGGAPSASSRSAVVRTPSPDPVLERSRLEYQETLSRELRNQEAAKSQFEKNEELATKIADWHASLAKKLEEAEKRGPFNVDEVAGKILDSFPKNTESGENPVMPFQDLVKGQCDKDISRYFFACLQLANERNIDMFHTGDDPLAPGSVMVRQLRTTRVRGEVNEFACPPLPDKTATQASSSQASSSQASSSQASSSQASSSQAPDEPSDEPTNEPDPEPSSSNTQTKRKRNSNSSSSSDSIAVTQQKKVPKSTDETESNEPRKRKTGSKNKAGKKRKDDADQ